MKKYKRILSCIIAICMLLSLSSTAFAADDISIDPNGPQEATKEPARVEEIVALREANSKTYQLSDGSYQYVGYAEDIHYSDSNNNLQEINDEITSDTRKNGYRYTNKANSWNVYFSKDISASEPILLIKGNYQLSFSLPDAIGNSTLTKASEKKNIEKGYYEELAKDNRSVVYENVFSDVDIAYTVRTNVLKEDIVLRSNVAPTEYTFDVNTKGLSLVEKNEHILFCDNKGNTVFQLAPMYMEDANGKHSDEVSCHVEKTENGCKITVIADSSFLKASDTAYPVVVDPSIMVTGTSDTFDTCIDQQYPASNYYTSPNLWTGGKLNTNAMRTYMKFNLPTNISASSITSAYLRIKKSGNATPTIKAYRATNSWSSSSLTWNNHL